MNIQEIKQLDDGEVIPPFTATIQFVNEHKGKVQTLKLTDDVGESIKAVLIMRPEVTMAMKGKTVRIEKAIASDNTWNDKTTREVKLLKGGVFKLNGSVSQDGTPTNKEFKEHVKEVVNGNSGQKPVFGGTAGCAAKLAVDVLLHDSAINHYSSEYFKSREFSQDVYQISSDLVRVMQLIESGKLAPSAKEREALVEDDGLSQLLSTKKDNVVEAAQELFQAEEGDDHDS